ncbi:MAG: ribose 5-phosphate isomerase B [Candidatus Adiutrix sp.]|jgi:ribose 5-phosphate isomerase B|nr:ribose 5-phosphate isomerase B [Candidatus Adiutrix sp.]
MRLVIASDHAGRRLKKAVYAYLKEQGHDVRDLGVPDEVERADYPDYAAQVAEAVTAGGCELGILVCGTGTGMALAANRVRGARAANCTDEFLARMARAHNNANILALGERTLGEGLALAIVEAFLNTPFEGGRHQDRLNKF